MKKYLADLLTLMRLILAVILLVLAFIPDASLAAGFLIFVIGELTDAFDGTLATKYPFPKNRTPRYRKYAAKYDMFTDALLAAAMGLFFILQVNLIAGLIIALGYSLASCAIEFIIYGKLMGHPDDFRPHSLMAKNFKLAKTIILARRNVYIALIAIVATWTLYASEFPLVVKIIFTVIAAIISIFLWLFLKQRRQNISRDAVKIEKQLEQKKFK